MSRLAARCEPSLAGTSIDCKDPGQVVGAPDDDFVGILREDRRGLADRDHGRHHRRGYAERGAAAENVTTADPVVDRIVDQPGHRISAFTVAHALLLSPGKSGSDSGDTPVLIINQLREKIGVMFGSPETTTGGRALKFYASVRLDVRRIETLKDGQEMVGNRTRVKVVKNKVAPPFKQAEFDILYGQGISREGSLIDLGVDTGIIRKAGAWFTYDADQLGQGRENARSYLRNNPDLADELEKEDQGTNGYRPEDRSARRHRSGHR